jgi:hypothetical protein
MGITVNSIRNRKVAKEAADNYNKAAKAKQSQEEVVEAQDDLDMTSAEAISELKEEVAEEEASVVEEVVEEVEEPSEELSLDSMTKDELEIYARENLDLELDKRKKKTDLIAEIIEASN